MSLPTLLQMVAIERTSCTLRVRCGDRSGHLFVSRGELVHATTGELQGAVAVRAIVGWAGEAHVDIEPGCAVLGRTIDGPMEGLLLEGLIEEELRRERAKSTRSGQLGGSIATEAGKELLMNRLQAIVEHLREEIPGFVATDIVSIESGLSIAGGSTEHELDTSAAPAAYAEVVKANRFALGLLDLDPDSTEDILITTDRIYMLLRMLGRDYYHLLAIQRKGNLGLARVIMKRYQGALMAGLRDVTRAASDIRMTGEAG